MPLPACLPGHGAGNHVCMVSDREEVPWPCYTDRLDYELELAIVVCR